MMRPRIIPVLLLKGNALVKSIRFRDHIYIGDPINAARIFNDLWADELILLDIEASAKDRLIPLDLLNSVAEEMTAPLSVGGGIRSLDDIHRVIDCGVEKVVIGTAAEPSFINEAAKEFGSSTITVCIDVDRDRHGNERVMTLAGRNTSEYPPVEFARLMESSGAGELIVQSVDRDGTFSGYAVPLLQKISSAVRIPVVALGGAGCEDDMTDAVVNGKVAAAAAGSMFVFAGKSRGVLINYAARNELHI